MSNLDTPKKPYDYEITIYLQSGDGLRVGQVGPRDPRRDAILGVYIGIYEDCQFNQYHTRFRAFLASIVAWVVAGVSIGIVFDVLLYIVRLLASGDKAQLIGLEGFYMSIICAMTINAMIMMPYIFYLGYRHTKSFWVCFKFAVWGRFGCGGSGRIGMSSVGPVIFYD